MVDLGGGAVVFGVGGWWFVVEVLLWWVAGYHGADGEIFLKKFGSLD